MTSHPIFPAGQPNATAATSVTPVSPLVRPHDLVFAEASPLLNVLEEAAQVAKSEATVLLTGETGTGKEVFARHVHRLSPRHEGPFVPVNCGAIPENLLESELFGHVRGAFTGAHHARKGRIALAEGGTLFLDEVGELPLALQVKLLRVLQERTYEPVGATQSVHANFRLVVATNRDLGLEVQAGRFRQDLFFRLYVCPLTLPPLRSRPIDVPVLISHFWARRKEKRPFTNAAMAALCRYSWPGNVRELENLVERVAVCTAGPKIDLADLPASYRGGSPNMAAMATLSPLTQAPHAEQRGAALGPDLPWLTGQAAPSMAESARSLPFAAQPAPARDGQAAIGVPLLPDVSQDFDLPTLLRAIEAHYIDAALMATSNNKQAAARRLGLRRTTLVEKLRRREQKAAKNEGAAIESPPLAAIESTRQLAGDRQLAPPPARQPHDAIIGFAAAGGVF